VSGQTVAQKVLARAAGLPRVDPGQIVDARIDRIVVNENFHRMQRALVAAGFPDGFPRFADLDRFHLMIEHFQPAQTAQEAGVVAGLRALVARYGIRHFTDATCGVMHRMVLEDIAIPGELALGNDSHSCAWGALNCAGTGMSEKDLIFALITGELWFKVPATIRIALAGRPAPWLSSKDIVLHLAGNEGAGFGLYRALEFDGPGVAHLSVEARMGLATHAVELGAKFGLFPFDAAAEAFLAARPNGAARLAAARPVAADPDAAYERSIAVDLDALTPQVAVPHTIGNVHPVEAVAGEALTIAVIGSCANGHVEDLRAAAAVLRGRRVADGMRLFVQPSSWAVYRQSMREGLLETLLEAGAQVLSPGCHACQGRQPALSAEDRCITSTTRNYRGRMGHAEARIFLASPQTVAASALAGRIADPREALR
jgi:3-isopropylmalate/(R)-2-methylmalate dehydratase large subunit